MNPELYLRYISNGLAEEERDALRLQLLVDPDSSDAFAELEAERIDALAAGRLAPPEAAELRAYLRETRQESRIPVALALSKPRRGGVSPYAIGLALAAVLLLTFPFLRLSRERQAIAPAAVITVPLLPGTLRGAGDVQQVRRQPGRIDLQLQYIDIAPAGQCRVEIEGVVAESVCGVSEHTVPMPLGLRNGRHRVDLTYANGAERVVYFFDLVD